MRTAMCRASRAQKKKTAIAVCAIRSRTLLKQHLTSAMPLPRMYFARNKSIEHTQLLSTGVSPKALLAPASNKRARNIRATDCITKLDKIAILLLTE